MSTRFFTDSTADLSPQQAAERGLELIYFPYYLDEAEYSSDPSSQNRMDSDEFYRLMEEEHVVRTAQIPPSYFTERFEKILQEGDDVFYLAFSSGLSGTADNATVVARELMEKYPGRTIWVVDTLCASAGQGLLADMAMRLHRAGKSDREVYAWCMENRLHAHHLFTVGDLTYLKRSGRVSVLSAIMGGMLNIKPLLFVDAKGFLISLEKVQGRKKSLRALVDRMERLTGGEYPQELPLYVSHSYCEEDARLLQRLLEERFHRPVDIVSSITPTIGAHCGPGVLAIFFFSEQARGL